MSSSNKEFLPPSPYISIRSPTDVAKCHCSKVVYGFPLSSEWLQHCYHHEVELVASEEAPVEERSVYLANFAWYLSGMCQKIHRVKCTTMVVETSRYGKGVAMFLIVGYPGHKPPSDTLRTLINRLGNYSIVKDPGWYPRA